MDSIFEDLEWGDWFSEQGVWFLVTLVVAVLGYIMLRMLTPRVIKFVLDMVELGTDEEEAKIYVVARRDFLRIELLIIVGITIYALLPRFGVDISPANEAIVDWLSAHGWRILMIVALAAIFHQIARKLIYMIVERSAVGGKRRSKVELEKRVETLSGFLAQIIEVVIWLMAILMILSELGVNIGPLLAGAGIIGIAIGFGAQSLIKDVLSGCFIIIENQYSKGDWITVAGISGEVEGVNIRRTILRDLDGIVHVVPNGEIRVASNYTKEYGRINLDISVAYGTDLDHAIEVINRVGNEIAADQYWGKAVLEPPYVLRVSNLGDSGIDIKVYGNTKRVRQWEVMGELRKRIKRTFDEEGIEIPWPHTKVYFGDVLRQHAETQDKSYSGDDREKDISKKMSRRRSKTRLIPTEGDMIDGEAEGDGDIGI